MPTLPRPLSSALALNGSRLLPIAFLAASACASGDQAHTLRVGETSEGLTQVTFAPNPGSLNMYKYVPSGMPTTARPLVVAMHGCGQDANTYQSAGWNALADQWKFYVVYPEQNKTKNNIMGCFNWGGRWQSAPQLPFSSQPLDLGPLKRGYDENESIKEMVDQMKKDHAIDASRVYITGLSAGGGMVSVMLATWPDVFAGGAIMAGIPYGCAMVHKTTDEASACLKDYSGGDLERTGDQWAQLVKSAYPGYAGPWPKVSIWHGTIDGTVNFHSEAELIKQWTSVHGVPATPSASDTVDGFPHKVFKNGGGDVVVEAYELTGKDHGTAVAHDKPVDPATPGGPTCGTAGQYFPDGICSTYHVGKFWGLDGTSSGGSDAGTDGATLGADGSASGGTPGSSGGTPAGSSGQPGAGGYGGTAQNGANGSSGSSGSSGSAGYSTSGVAGCSASRGGASSGFAASLVAVAALFAARRRRRARA